MWQHLQPQSWRGAQQMTQHPLLSSCCCLGAADRWVRSMCRQVSVSGAAMQSKRCDTAWMPSHWLRSTAQQLGAAIRQPKMLPGPCHAASPAGFAACGFRSTMCSVTTMSAAGSPSTCGRPAGGNAHAAVIGNKRCPLTACVQSTQRPASGARFQQLQTPGPAAPGCRARCGCPLTAEAGAVVQELARPYQPDLAR